MMHGTLVGLTTLQTVTPTLRRLALWTGNGFVMPPKVPVEPETGHSRQHLKLGGKSAKTKNIRSATPRGFAIAVMAANTQKDTTNGNQDRSRQVYKIQTYSFHDAVITVTEAFYSRTEVDPPTKPNKWGHTPSPTVHADGSEHYYKYNHWEEAYCCSAFAL